MGAVQVEETTPYYRNVYNKWKAFGAGKDNSPWTVYACINRDDDLFYFVLMDDSEEAVEDFEEAIYQTKLA